MAATSNEFTPYKMLLTTLQQMGKILSLPLARSSQLQKPDPSNQKLAAELLGHFHPPSSPRTPAKCPFAAHFKSSKPIDEINNNVESRKRSDLNQILAPKPFSAMPKPKALPFVGTLFDLIQSGAAPKIHMYCDKRHKQLGPIYTETLGSLEAVFVSDAAIIKHVFATEGRYPHHLVPEPWTIYNEATGNERGLFFMNGPLWRTRRRALNKVFLRRSALADQMDDFVNITDDLMQRWKELSQPDPQLVLPELEKELYSWSIECLGNFIFGRRMGCVSAGVNSPQVDDEIHTFVQSVQQIFVESAQMTTVPPRLAYYLNLNVWKRFSSAVTSALTIARSLVENKIREIVVKAETGEPVDGLLAKLLLEDNIDEEELVRIVTDLFLAAADTTSHSTQWALHLLAKNRECQEKLRQEIDEVIPKGEEITLEKVCRLPYARAVVKEALRLYPVAPFLTRILTDDVVLGGYKVPKGKLILMSMYTTGRDAEYFENPDQFLPERWLPGSTSSAPTHASLPFGSGTRSCIGRRIAETQMYLLLAQVVRRFDIESANEQEVDITLRMVTTPSEPIRLRLVERE